MTTDPRADLANLGDMVPSQRGARDPLTELIVAELGRSPRAVAELPDVLARPGTFGRAGLDAVRCAEDVFPRLAGERVLPRALRTALALLRGGGVLVAAVPEFGEHRPIAAPPRVTQVDGGQELTTAVWDWSADGESYRLDLLRLRRYGEQWELVDTVSTRHRVLHPKQVHALLVDTGFEKVRRVEVAESGHPIPIWVAVKPRAN